MMNSRRGMINMPTLRWMERGSVTGLFVTGKINFTTDEAMNDWVSKFVKNPDFVLLGVERD